MVKVKVCGIKRLGDALAAIELGADFLGFNFWPGTPRFIDAQSAKKIIAKVKGRAKIVGVFVNQSLAEVNKIVDALNLDYAQLHGEEPPDFCRAVHAPVIKTLRLGSARDMTVCDGYEKVIWLVDSKTKKFGGSGKSPDWKLAKKSRAKLGEIILAGGLNAENVGDAIQMVGPWAVDVASGVEKKPGVKDRAKLKKFFEAVKNASR